MNLEQIKIKKEEIEKQILDLYAEKSKLEEKEAGLINIDIFKLIKNTKWTLPVNCYVISLIQDENSKQFVKYIQSKLYPHGHMKLCEDAEIFCDDSAIGIHVHKSNIKSFYKKVINFASEHSLKLDLSTIKKDLSYYKKQTTEKLQTYYDIVAEKRRNKHGS